MRMYRDMGRRLKFGLSILGILALMFAAFMLPTLITHVAGTWAFFTSQTESSQITIRTGFWEDEDAEQKVEQVIEEETSIGQQETDLEIVETTLSGQQETDLIIQTETQSGQIDGSSLDVNAGVPDQTNVTEGNNNAENTISAE